MSEAAAVLRMAAGRRPWLRKPHLIKCNGQWRCEFSHCIAWATTPKAAQDIACSYALLSENSRAEWMARQARS